MNERIQKLADKADLYVDLNGNPWPRAMSAEECEVAYKKFAELIVLRCAGIYEMIDNGNLQMGTDDYLEALRRHFGVK